MNLEGIYCWVVRRSCCHRSDSFVLECAFQPDYLVYTYIHTYKRIHIYIHSYIHRCINSYIHIYIHTYTHTRTYVRTYIHTYIRKHAYTHVVDDTYTQIRLVLNLPDRKYNVSRGMSVNRKRNTPSSDIVLLCFLHIFSYAVLYLSHCSSSTVYNTNIRCGDRSLSYINP